MKQDAVDGQSGGELYLMYTRSLLPITTSSSVREDKHQMSSGLLKLLVNLCVMQTPERLLPSLIGGTITAKSF